METLLRRLKYYGVGFGIGLIFVFFFFRNRGCSWLPDNRVKNAVLDRLIVVPDETKEQMIKLNLKNEDVIEALNTGNVDFSGSKRDGDKKIYLVNSAEVNYAFTLPKESFIAEVFIAESIEGIKEQTNGFAEIISLPKDEYLVFPDTTALVQCKQQLLELEEASDILDLIKEGGRLDYKNTRLDEKPKPVHRLIIQKDSLEIGLDAIWYKTKVNIIDLKAQGLEDCH